MEFTTLHSWRMACFTTRHTTGGSFLIEVLFARFPICAKFEGIITSAFWRKGVWHTSITQPPYRATWTGSIQVWHIQGVLLPFYHGPHRTALSSHYGKFEDMRDEGGRSSIRKWQACIDFGRTQDVQACRLFSLSTKQGVCIGSTASSGVQEGVLWIYAFTGVFSPLRTHDYVRIFVLYLFFLFHFFSFSLQLLAIY